MRVTFRADASHEIGSGHVMRCLALADALSADGAECSFITREHTGDLNTFIKSKGYTVYSFPISSIENHVQRESLLSAEKDNVFSSKSTYGSWLGTLPRHDASQCLEILHRTIPDWLVVDHYALDSSWESMLRNNCNKLMVIDDLANRKHDCDLLVDQTLNRNAEEYRDLVPSSCHLLCGSHYALLRPEFSELREYSLKRRKRGPFKKILISLGGVDKDNLSGLVLEWLSSYSLPEDITITIVLGEKAPWINKIEKQVKLMPWPTELIVGTSRMASLMADSDLAIGAAGTTAWERCCMGLPSIVFIQASNQLLVSHQLERKGAAIVIDLQNNPKESLKYAISKFTDGCFYLLQMVKNSAEVTNGTGVRSVLYAMGGVKC